MNAFYLTVCVCMCMGSFTGMDKNKSILPIHLTENNAVFVCISSLTHAIHFNFSRSIQLNATHTVIHTMILYSCQLSVGLIISTDIGIESIFVEGMKRGAGGSLLLFFSVWPLSFLSFFFDLFRSLSISFSLFRSLVISLDCTERTITTSETNQIHRFEPRFGHHLQFDDRAAVHRSNLPQMRCHNLLKSLSFKVRSITITRQIMCPFVHVHVCMRARNINFDNVSCSIDRRI